MDINQRDVKKGIEDAFLRFLEDKDKSWYGCRRNVNIQKAIREGVAQGILEFLKLNPEALSNK